MLKLTRRPVADFLAPEHRQALEKRGASARKLADDPVLTSEERSKRIRQQWDAFRAGRTSAGTFEALWVELRAMAFEKCALCEVPSPDTTEHLEGKAGNPSRAFDWNNLLPACSQCNLARQNSLVTTTPFDPSAADVEPLDYFGWDEYGDFAPNPRHQETVRDLVKMYGLHRLREARRERITTFRALLIALINEEASADATKDALRVILSGTSAWLGPIREYLLRPPFDTDALLVEGALMLMPEIRSLVEPWLRPPPWSPAWWH